MNDATETITKNFESFHAIMRLSALAKNASKDDRLAFLQEIYDLASKSAEENNEFLENSV